MQLKQQGASGCRVSQNRQERSVDIPARIADNLVTSHTGNLAMKCRICGRSLDQPDDPLSMNCGGDCWGCIGETEADLGNVDSIDQFRKEHVRGLRPAWIDPDK